MSLALAQYLLKQGYNENQITILTTYSGQLSHFDQIRVQYKGLENIEIATVDSYQGEENLIIILSLVRSNRFKKIGFLKTPNRVCVALSRAQHGFYMLGNMDALQKAPLWNKIKERLQANGEIGTAFKLKCKNHDTITMVNTTAYLKTYRNDLTKLEYLRLQVDNPKCFPLGGCKKKCDTQLSCGHRCPKRCHLTDTSHSLPYQCMHPCSRVCANGHACLKKCFKICDECQAVNVVNLACGHQVNVDCLF